MNPIDLSPMSEISAAQRPFGGMAGTAHVTQRDFGTLDRLEQMLLGA